MLIERAFWYAGAFSLAANQTAYDQRIDIRPTADFYARAFGMYNSTGAIAARLRRADGAFIAGNDFAHLNAFVDPTAAAYKPWPWYPQVRYPASGAFVMDLQDLGGAGDPTIYPVLYGVERMDSAVLPPAGLPQNYVEHDHTISLNVNVNGAGAQVLEIPVECQTGDAFAIRAFAWRFSGAEPVTMHCRLWDQASHLFMNNWVPLRLMMGSPHAAAQTTLPAPYPQMVIPARGRFTMDFWNRTEAGNYNLQVSFIGARLVEA